MSRLCKKKRNVFNRSPRPSSKDRKLGLKATRPETTHGLHHLTCPLETLRSLLLCTTITPQCRDVGDRMLLQGLWHYSVREQNNSVPSWSKSFFLAPPPSPLTSKLKFCTSAPDWQSIGHMQVNYCLMGHTLKGHLLMHHTLMVHMLLDHMLTPKEAKGVSFCLFLKAEFMFMKQREVA